MSEKDGGKGIQACNIFATTYSFRKNRELFIANVSCGSVFWVQGVREKVWFGYRISSFFSTMTGIAIRTK